MPRTTRPQPVLIFLHLPKTAGTTLTHVLERQYNSHTTLALYTSSDGEELSSIPQSKLESLCAVIGHFYFGLHVFLSRPSTYITLLRDPVERVLSHYYFVQRDPTHYLYRSSHKMSLKEFVVSSNAAEPNNDQTRLLAGKHYGSNFETCSDEMLSAAKRNLRDYFAVVGLTEEFDRSLILMKRIFGWSSPFYTRQNVSKYRSQKREIPRETLRVIREYNALDCELYSYGRELFQEQVRFQASSFEKELYTFKKLNTFYGRLRVLTSSVASKLKQDACL